MSDLRGSCDYRNEVSRYFLALAPQNDLRKVVLTMNDNASDFNEEKQDILLSCTVHHPLALKFPPSLSYSRSFLKWIMHRAEEVGHAISEKIYIAYVDLIRSKQREICYQHYIVNSQLTITIEASQYLISNSTTGLKVWEAAKWLADWCMENAYLFKNKHILELGSGLGLTGLVVCQTCHVRSYTFSDNSQDVLRILRRNIYFNGLRISSSKEQNNYLDYIQDNEDSREFQLKKGTVRNCSCPISVIPLDWNATSPNEFNDSDILLAADIFYDPSYFDALVRLFHSFLNSEKSRKVYVAYVERNLETSRILSEKIEQMHLSQRKMKGPEKLNFLYSENIPLRVYELSS